MVRFIAKSVLLVLILLVGVPAIQAAELREVSSRGLLVELWAFLTSAWNENGCWVDPDGRCASHLSVPDTDNGCWVDPSGSCAVHQAMTDVDNGCGVDPSGACRH